MKTDYIVALSIDKVQTLLYEVIHSHVQEKQTETGTLRQIMNASHEISDRFFNRIMNALEGLIKDASKDVLLKCSGVVIFRCVSAAEKEIEERLNSLFLEYYYESHGQKVLKYTYFEAEGHNEIESIQKAKKDLKSSKCMGKIIEKNKEELFSFQKVIEQQDRGKDSLGELNLFVDSVNQLYPYDRKNKENPCEEHHFPIAVIKADLKGMGNMFGSITEYKDYEEISTVLNENISLEGLHKAAKKVWRNQGIPWILPFYAAGDDIFFAVSTTNLFQGISVCRQMLAQIKSQSDRASDIKMDIGVAITFNMEPIRYYIDTVEEQLKKAKKAKCPQELEKDLNTTVSVNNQTFFDVNCDEIKNKKKEMGKKERQSINRALMNYPIWSYFQTEVKNLQQLHSDEKTEQICSTSFLYSLLEKLSDIDLCGENPGQKRLEYMNILLYSLRLKHLDNPELREKELLIKGRLIEQLYVRKIKDRNNTKPGDTLILDESSKKKLETYIRLLILLTDSRFNSNDRKREVKCDSVAIKNMHKYLLKKPVDYLYDSLMKYDKELLHMIIVKDYYIMEGNRIPYYKRVSIEKSMFFKLRDTDKVSIEKAANMIELKNPEDKNKINTTSDDEKEKDKACYHMCFDRESFIKRAEAKNNWNADFIDSLMLLYEYNEMNIKFKGIKNGGAKNERKN